MPRYFFNLVMGKVVVYDRRGRDLEDKRTARLHAQDTARQVLKTPRAKPLDPSECFVEVADATGATLFTVPFAVAES
jgi:hypothetical protein